MNKFLSASALAILLTAVGVADFNAAGTASASTEEGDKPLHSMEQPQNHQPPKLEDVTRTVTNLDNGVTITLTTDNPDSLEKLQEILNDDHERPRDESVEESITLLDNGIEITLTSDDAEVVEQIQERSAREPGNGPDMTQTVTRTVTNLENGVQITLTSDDAEEVARLQEHAENPRPMHGMHGRPNDETDDGEETDA